LSSGINIAVLPHPQINQMAALHRLQTDLCLLTLLTKRMMMIKGGAIGQEQTLQMSPQRMKMPSL